LNWSSKWKLLGYSILSTGIYFHFVNWI